MKYQDHSGKQVNSDDENRLLWYGSGNCRHWTDDWTKFSGEGIPACPKCGCVGFQITAKEWFDEIEKYEADGHPGYLKELEDFKL